MRATPASSRTLTLYASVLVARARRRASRVDVRPILSLFAVVEKKKNGEREASSVKNGRRRGVRQARAENEQACRAEGQSATETRCISEARSVGGAQVSPNAETGRTNRASSGLGPTDHHIEAAGVARVVDDAESSGDEREHFFRSVVVFKSL